MVPAESVSLRQITPFSPLFFQPPCRKGRVPDPGSARQTRQARFDLEESRVRIQVHKPISRSSP